MRIATLSLDFGLLLLVLVALLHTQGSSAAPENNCESECVSSRKCELAMGRGVCGKSGQICCSILKERYRTACRHHGGECMNDCNDSLLREANDCPADQRCCVLV